MHDKLFGVVWLIAASRAKAVRNWYAIFTSQPPYQLPHFPNRGGGGACVGRERTLFCQLNIRASGSHCITRLLAQRLCTGS